MGITIENTFDIPGWDDFQRFKTVDFWERRGFVFETTGGPVLRARRGHWTGNLFSFDMSKLMSALTITVGRDHELHCSMEVKTFMQIITAYNRAWWDLEMEIFESFLLETDEQDARWQQFQTKYKNASITWTLTAGLGGSEMPPEYKP